MNISISDFVAVCPSGLMPNSSLVERIGVAFADARLDLLDIIPHTLMDSIEDSIDLSSTAESKEEKLWQQCLQYIIAKAYFDSVPQLDLVLTPTGFGVVSNQNLAPASSDRVLRLQAVLKRQWQTAYESIISELRYFKEWRLWPYRIITSSLFWHSSHLRKFGVPNPDKDMLDEFRTKINNGEAKLKMLVSPEFFSELVNAEMSATSEPWILMAIDLSRNFIAAAGEDTDVLLHRNTLLRFLDDNISEFTTYRASSAYTANHPEPYRNEKDDPCYFF